MANDPFEHDLTRFLPALDAAARARFGTLWRLHQRYRAKAALSAAITARDFVINFIMDSLQLVYLTPPAPGEAIADVGSGGGFPALPVAVVRSDLRLTLIEPAPKKAAYLRLAARELALDNVAVVEKRAEEVPGGGFDRVVAKAFKTPAAALKLLVPLARSGGGVDLLLGRVPPGISDSAARLGATVTAVAEYTLPGKDRPRAILELTRNVSRETNGQSAPPFHVKQPRSNKR